MRAPVAQWIEHWSSEPGVVGSNPPRRATLSYDTFSVRKASPHESLIFVHR